jgi:hypothetical protein
MTTTIPCPGCGTQLNLSDDRCPVCLRGRSKQEIVRTYARLRLEEEQRRRRPYQAVAALLASGAVAFILYLSWPLVVSAFNGVLSRLARFNDRITDPNYLRGVTGKAAAPLAPAPPPPAPPPPAPVFVAPAAPAPRPAPPPPLSVHTPKLQANQWALHGRVYNLLTLSPAPNASFTAYVGGNGWRTFESDGEGRYRVALNRLTAEGQSYEIQSIDPRYTTGVHYESDIPYLRLSAEERRQLVRSARDGDSRPTPLNDVIGENEMRRDLFVCPRQ